MTSNHAVARGRVRRRGAAVAAALTAAALALTGCGASSEAASDGADLDLVGFSILEQPNKQVFADFEKTAAGKDVAFKASYGASGDQSRAVAAGQNADLVHLSLETDITRLVDDGLVAKDWNTGPTKGIASQSVVVFVVRKGNPKNIQSWSDLVKPGVRIITPNPGSSGSARWNILAAWGSVIAGGGSEDDAKAYLTELFDHTVALPGSGREATTAFQSGNGDVLLSYENEAIFARRSGESVDYVIPKQNLLIENPGAVTTDASPIAGKFLDFATSAKGQGIYAEYGFRPVASVQGVDVDQVKGANDPADPFPALDELFTIDKTLGGWDSVNTKFFDDKDGIITRIIAESGKS